MALSQRRRSPGAQAEDQLLETVVNPGALQIHVEPDSAPVVAELRERGGDPVGAYELVVAGIDDDQVGGVAGHLLDEIEKAETVDRRQPAVYHLEAPGGVHVGQHLPEEAGEGGVGRVGKTGDSGGAEDEYAHCVRRLGLREAGAAGEIAPEPMREKAVGNLAIGGVPGFRPAPLLEEEAVRGPELQELQRRLEKEYEPHSRQQRQRGADQGVQSLGRLIRFHAFA